MYFHSLIHTHSLGHPRGLSESHAWKDSRISQLLFNTEQLIVLGRTFTSAGSARLDLARAETNGEISNAIVLGFSRTVRGHDTPTILFGQFDSVHLLPLHGSRRMGCYPCTRQRVP